MHIYIWPIWENGQTEIALLNHAQAWKKFRFSVKERRFLDRRSKDFSDLSFFPFKDWFISCAKRWCISNNDEYIYIKNKYKSNRHIAYLATCSTIHNNKRNNSINILRHFKVINIKMFSVTKIIIECLSSQSWPNPSSAFISDIENRMSSR